jgi:hypothetical protein
MSVNPYAPGAGTSPPVLVGREAQLAVIENSARLVEAGRSPQHVILTGLRGVGKTVLLKDAARRMRSRGWLCGYYEVRRNVDVGITISTIVAEGAGLLPKQARLRRALRSLRSSIGSATISGAADGSVSVQLAARDGSAPTGDPYLEALTLFRSLSRAAADDDAGVALCVDEVQLFRRRDAATLIQTLQAVDGTQDGRVLLLAAGLPPTPVELAKASSYAERFRYEPLDDLTAADARIAVAEAALPERVGWDPDALEAVVALARGYPFFLQLYASEAWDVAAERQAPLAQITLADVRAAEPRVRRRLDAGLYATRYGRSSLGEREYLVAIARAMPGDGGIARSGEVARALVKSLSELSPVRERLIQKGVIHAPTHGALAFSVPGFRDYLLRRGDGEGSGD